MSTKSYFELHAHHHAYHKETGFYFPIMDFIKKNNSGKIIRILDFGCGDGIFLKQLINGGISAEFFGMDISSSMINLAKKNLQNEKIQLFVGDCFRPPLREGIGFDIIHLDMVLHHFIGKTRTESFSLVQKILDVVISMLTYQGKIIIEEENYLSYISPSITSSIIFHGLKFLNALHLDISKLSNEIQPGLEVNFFHKKQLHKLLEKYGKVELIREKPAKITFGKRLFLLKECTHVSYSLSSLKSGNK